MQKQNVKRGLTVKRKVETLTAPLDLCHYSMT